MALIAGLNDGIRRCRSREGFDRGTNNYNASSFQNQTLESCDTHMQRGDDSKPRTHHMDDIYYAILYLLGTNIIDRQQNPVFKAAVCNVQTNILECIFWGPPPNGIQQNAKRTRRSSLSLIEDI